MRNRDPIVAVAMRIRLFNTVFRGTVTGLLVGYIFSERMTANASDAQLRAGESMNCLFALLLCTLGGGLLGLVGQLRTRQPEAPADAFDHVTAALVSAVVLYNFYRMPSFMDAMDGTVQAGDGAAIHFRWGR